MRNFDREYINDFSNKYWAIRDRLKDDIMHSSGLTDSEYEDLLGCLEDVLGSQRYCNKLHDLFYSDDTIEKEDNIL